ncbi:hypothetical protein BS47DRAFT_1339522 [Hydnum rufescens UP504]|uniref:Uncharacterized protein n=1 Tax=Hydnum rufescens UP504 TaxID=1448309 RepID=A0A9P6B6S2_9AGAM|nr:hypothetical protein BS47DRAFT_1339522 [Hydnum rufescens UP504]
MYMDTSCCVPHCSKFEHIFVVWASTKSRSHRLKSSDATLTEHDGGGHSCFFHPP